MKNITLFWPNLIFKEKGRIIPSLFLAKYYGLLKDEFNVSCVETFMRGGINKADFLQNKKEISRKLESDIRKIESTNPDILCISSWTLLNLPYILEFSRHFKKRNKDVKIILGGDGPTNSPKNLSTLTKHIDFFIVGCGEHAVCKLIKDIVNKKNIGQNIIHMRNRFPPISTIIPDYSGTLDENRHKIIPLEGSTGCTNNCTFCSSQKWIKGPYNKGVDTIIKELKQYISNYNINRFFFIDNNFTGNPKNAELFCRMLKKNKLDINWSCSSRTDTISPRLLNLMHDSGCYSIFYGIESLNKNTLKLTKKTKDPSRYIKKSKEMINYSRDLLATKVEGIIGFPWESKKDMLETVSFFRNNWSDIAYIHTLIAIPGSKIWRSYLNKELELFGSKILHNNLFFEKYKNLPWLVPTAWRVKNKRMNNKDLTDFVEHNQEVKTKEFI